MGGADSGKSILSERIRLSEISQGKSLTDDCWGDRTYKCHFQSKGKKSRELTLVQPGALNLIQRRSKPLKKGKVTQGGEPFRN